MYLTEHFATLCLNTMQQVQPPPQLLSLPQLQNLQNSQLSYLLQALGQQPTPQHIAYLSVGHAQGNVLGALLAGLLNHVYFYILLYILHVKYISNNFVLLSTMFLHLLRLMNF